MHLIDLLQDECKSAGIECFVVGGALRDRLLNRTIQEVDLIVATSLMDIAGRLVTHPGVHGFWLDKEREALRLSTGEETIDLAPLSGQLSENLEQRDFTCNAIAQRLDDYLEDNRELIDPCGGQDDLSKRSLRPIHDGSMQADPIRVLRGIRLLVTRQLQLNESSADLLCQAAKLIPAMPAERTSQELAKILTSSNASAGVSYLYHLGVVEHLLPEVFAMQGVTQNKYHQYTVDDHARKAFGAFSEIIHGQTFLPERAKAWTSEYWSGLSQDARYALMLAAWLHDIGKPPTRAVRNGKVTFYGHEHVGATMATAIANRLRLSRQQSALLSAFIEYHMYPMQLWRTGKLDGKLLHRYFYRAGAVGVPVVLFTLADHLAKGDAVADSGTFHEHVRVVERFLEAWFLYRAEIISPRPLLTGDEIADVLRRQPGPWLRKVKELLLEAQANGQVADKERAKQYVLHAADEAHRVRHRK